MENNIYDLYQGLNTSHKDARGKVKSLLNVFRSLVDTFDIEKSMPAVSRNQRVYCWFDDSDGDKIIVQVQSWEENRDWIVAGQLHIFPENGFHIGCIDTYHSNDREYVDTMYDLADYIKEQVRFHWTQRAVK